MKMRIISFITFMLMISYSLNKSEEEKCNIFEKDLINEFNNDPNTKVLKKGYNEIKVNKNEQFTLNFTNLNYDKAEQDLLIYTDLNKVSEDISQFDIFNETLYAEKIIKFTPNEDKSCFLDIEIVNKGEFVVNKNITREGFYKGVIDMRQNDQESKFYVNLIPSDNNSDLYFFQTNISSVRDDNKDRINLYYFNDFGNKKLGEVISYIKANPMKRERCINGKVEIFGFDYKNLDKDIKVKIGYTQIKGTGILGPILSLSILFAALVVVTAIFIKNTYFDTGYKNKTNLKADE